MNGYGNQSSLSVTFTQPSPSSAPLPPFPLFPSPSPFPLYLSTPPLVQNGLIHSTPQTNPPPPPLFCVLSSSTIIIDRDDPAGKTAFPDRYSPFLFPSPFIPIILSPIYPLSLSPFFPSAKFFFFTSASPPPSLFLSYFPPIYPLTLPFFPISKILFFTSLFPPPPPPSPPLSYPSTLLVRLHPNISKNNIYIYKFHAPKFGTVSVEVF